MDKALELIISVYRNTEQAEAVLKELRRQSGDHTFEIRDAAVISKDSRGHTHLKDTGDVKASRGALFGAITGAAVGLLGGPGGAVVGAAAGAATGAATAATLDMGFPDDQLRDLQASMPASSSALVVLVEHTWAEELVRELERDRTTMFRHTVNPNLIDQYEQGAARH